MIADSISIHGARAPDVIFDRRAWGLVLICVFLIYIPVFAELFRGPWRTSDEAHEPLVLLVDIWLFWRSRATIFAAPKSSRHCAGWLTFILALTLYILGRSQSVLTLEVGALPCIVLALLFLLDGSAATSATAMALSFMLFAVPLPGALVDAITQPMARAVSQLAEQLLFWGGYPVARSGVVIQIGPYQLLVAEACAGLRSLFALEAMAFLYLALTTRSSARRTIVLVLFTIPIALAANVIRVTALALITYHFGDAAGQGFLHEFSGLVMYCVALTLIFCAGSALQAGIRKAPRTAAV